MKANTIRVTFFHCVYNSASFLQKDYSILYMVHYILLLISYHNLVISYYIRIKDCMLKEQKPLQRKILEPAKLQLWRPFKINRSGSPHVPILIKSKSHPLKDQSVYYFIYQEPEPTLQIFFNRVKLKIHFS